MFANDRQTQKIAKVFTHKTLYQASTNLFVFKHILGLRRVYGCCGRGWVAGFPTFKLKSKACQMAVSPDKE